MGPNLRPGVKVVLDPVSPPHVMSINVGTGVTRPYASGPTTAIAKGRLPEDALVEVRDPGPKRGGLGSGVVGDEIGDPKHHGGSQQAVYAYAREDQQWWEGELGRPLAPGAFGENLTTVGVDTTHALIGEVWRLGDVVLQGRGTPHPLRARSPGTWEFPSGSSDSAPKAAPAHICPWCGPGPSGPA